MLSRTKIALALIAGTQAWLVAGATAAPMQGKSAIDPAALAILKRSADTMLALKSFRAECRSSMIDASNAANTQYYISKLTERKPNLMRYDVWRLDGSDVRAGWQHAHKSPLFTLASNGADTYTVYSGSYLKRKTDTRMLVTQTEPWAGFFRSADTPYSTVTHHSADGTLLELKKQGREPVAGVLCDKIYFAIQLTISGSSAIDKETWFIGPDHVVRQSFKTLSVSDGRNLVQDSILTGIKVNGRSERVAFQYTPPSDVTPYQADTSQGLLANGTRAPSFTAYDVNNRRVRLSDFRGKVVVVDFWATWCGPCMQSMPHNQEVLSKLKRQGLPVVLLAVDDGEPKAGFDEWVKDRAPIYSALNFVYSPQTARVSGGRYRVTGIPTQYVVDQNGIIRASSVGFGGPTEDLENSIRACLRTARK